MKTVLLVDDEESTRIFVHFALTHFRESVHLRYLRDGVQAMRYLQGFGLYSDRRAHPFPDLVLLDLKMPLVDGFEVLEWTRAQSAFKQLPIVVMSGSTYPPEFTRALQLGATSFVAKVVDLMEFEQALKDVIERLLVVAPPTPSQVSTQLAKAA